MNEMTGLIVDLEVKVNKLERGMKTAIDKQRKAADQMERRAKQSADRINDTYGKMSNGIGASFSKLGKLALPFAGGLLAGVAAGGVAGIVGNLDRMAQGIAAVGDEAARAGLSSQAFQEWRFVADQNRVSVDALVDGFKELSLRSDEYISTGIGPAAEAFGRLGISADSLKEKLKDPSALMLEILGRLEGFDKAAQIRIADEIFGGTGGEQFVQLIGQGEQALRATIDRAYEAGAVLDDELIQRAAEIDRRFGELTSRVGTFAKTAVVEIAAAGLELADFRDRLDGIFASEGEGRSILGDEVYDALARDRQAVDDQADALRRLDAEYQRAAETADRAGMAMAGAIGTLDGFGYDRAADSLRGVYSEMQELTRSFRDGEISGEAFTARLTDLETAAQAAFAELEAGDRVTFGGVISQLDSLGGVITGIISLAASMKAAIADAAGVGAATQQGTALRQRQDAEAASMDSLNAQRDTLDRFTDAETARNTATSEQLRLQREVEAVRTRAGEAGAPITNRQATEAAQASLAADDARREAEQAARGSGAGAGAGGAGGGSSPAKLEGLAAEAKAIRDKTAALQIEAGVLAEVATSQTRHADAAGYADAKVRLLSAAQEQGRTITSAQMAEIDRMAEAYSRAGNAAEIAGKKLRDQARQSSEAMQTGADAVGSIIDSAMNGSASLADTLSNLGKQIIRNIILQQIYNAISKSSGGGGILGTAMSALGSGLTTPTMPTAGFSDGGYTGPGGKYEPAGIVHAGEYVFSKATVSRLGVGNLEALHQSAQKGYAEGGLVGTTGRLKAAASGRAGGATAAPVINITGGPVTVNATGGTPEQNSDLAAQVAAQTEKAMRQVVRDEMIRQSRPGAMLSRR